MGSWIQRIFDADAPVIRRSLADVRRLSSVDELKRACNMYGYTPFLLVDVQQVVLVRAPGVRLELL